MANPGNAVLDLADSSLRLVTTVMSSVREWNSPSKHCFKLSFKKLVQWNTLDWKGKGQAKLRKWNHSQTLPWNSVLWSPGYGMLILGTCCLAEFTHQLAMPSVLCALVSVVLHWLWYHSKTPLESNHIWLLFRSIALSPCVSAIIFSHLGPQRLKLWNIWHYVYSRQKNVPKKLKRHKAILSSYEVLDRAKRNAEKIDFLLKKPTIWPV